MYFTLKLDSERGVLVLHLFWQQTICVKKSRHLKYLRRFLRHSYFQLFSARILKPLFFVSKSNQKIVLSAIFIRLNLKIFFFGVPEWVSHLIGSRITRYRNRTTQRLDPEHFHVERLRLNMALV